jgi:ornithine decarboxylase
MEGVLDLSTLIHNHNVQLFEYDDTPDAIYNILSKYIEKNQSSGAYYIVNLSNIKKKIMEWKQYLSNIKPFYAVKCNPNNVILELLNMYGFGFDCASKNEIASLISKSANPENIIYANPCKEPSLISYARSQDVDMLTFDCETELYKIKLNHEHAKLILRIKTDDSDSECRFSMKFGADMVEIEQLVNIMKVLKLNLYGLSFHVGSNCKNPKSFYKAIKSCREIYDLCKQKFNIDLKLIDIGGGFPGSDTEQLTFHGIAEEINNSFAELFPEFDFSDPECPLKLIAEPGRFIVTDSHTLVLNVIGKKYTIDNEGNKVFAYYLNDSLYGSFNCISFDHAHPKLLPYNERSDKEYKSVVFGNTCDGQDIISSDCQLPDLAIGEVVFVQNFGAYTTASSSNFNGFQVAPCKYMLYLDDQ